jgi:uncharacterized membrane protein
MTNRTHETSRAERVYARLLTLYPAEFRREYGREMALVFAARWRADQGSGAAWLRLWRETLADLARTVAREHLDRLSRRGAMMKTLRTVVLALVAYAFTLAVVAPFYARNADALPPFVSCLIDALIFTGVVFNFIFLALTLPRWLADTRAVRAALVLTTGIVAVLVTVMMVQLGSPLQSRARIVVAQIIALLIWYSIHLWWVRRTGATAPPVPA